MIDDNDKKKLCQNRSNLDQIQLDFYPPLPKESYISKHDKNHTECPKI